MVEIRQAQRVAPVWVKGIAVRERAVKALAVAKVGRQVAADLVVAAVECVAAAGNPGRRWKDDASLR